MRLTDLTLHPVLSQVVSCLSVDRPAALISYPAPRPSLSADLSTAPAAQTTGNVIIQQLHNTEQLYLHLDINMDALRVFLNQPIFQNYSKLSQCQKIHLEICVVTAVLFLIP